MSVLTFLQRARESWATENIPKYHILEYGHQYNVHWSGGVHAPPQHPRLKKLMED